MKQEEVKHEISNNYCNTVCCWRKHMDCLSNTRNGMTKEALKLALEALENHEGNYKLGDAGCDRQEKAINAIKEALAQPEQEPFTYYDPARDSIRPFRSEGDIPLYTTPQPKRKPLTDEKVSLIAHNIDSGDWSDLNFKECWHEGFKAGFREAEIEHNIKG